MAGPVRFGCAATELVIPSATLAIPLRTAAPALASVLEEQIERLLALVQRPVTVTSKLYEVLLSELRSGAIPSVGRAARRLAMSPRTLQRHLAEEATTFERSLSDLRRDLAKELLRSNDRSVKEVASALGFSGARAFTRAFQRWTGEAPRAHRFEATKRHDG